MSHVDRGQATSPLPLTAERWKTIEPLIDAAVDLSPEDRHAFLVDACRGDDALRAEVELLLAHYDRRDTLLDHPAAERFGALVDSGIANLPPVLADRYRVDREIGRGGMAVVYLAWDLRHERHVAVKVLHPYVAATLGVERFLNEIKTTARLNDPHILTLHDSGESDGFVFFVMPYVETGSLRRRIGNEGQLPIDDAVRIAREVASALASAHRDGVIHRDVKPENILLHNGSALVADFGIALAVSAATTERTMTPGPHLGTPEYMSPEQASADEGVDGRSDVYALGTVLYEMLAGATPFTGDSAAAIVAKRATLAPASIRVLRPAVPPSIDAVVTRALAREPADRYGTAEEFADALVRAAQFSSGSPRIQNPDRAKRSALGWWIGAFGVLLIAAVAIAVAARDRAATTPRSTVASSDNSLAVLPLAIVGNDTTDTYFADGMTDELSSGLVDVRGIRLVSGRSAASLARRPDPDFEDLGRKLGVTMLLAGRIRREGNRLGVAVDLVNSTDGTVRWTKAYSAQIVNLTDLYAVRDSIVRDIVDQLKLTLDSAQILAAARRGTRDLDAWDLYSQGRYFFEQRRREKLDTSLVYFHRAIARDSNFAEAYSAIADVNSTFAIGNVGDFRPDEYFPRARAAARRALDLNERSADAHASMGVVLLLYDLDWEGAQRELERALALNSRLTMARIYRAILLEFTGRFDEAVLETRVAVRLDPLSPFASTEAGRALFFQRNYEGAASQFRRILERDSTQIRSHLLLGQVLEQQGKLDSAVAEMAAAVRFAPNSSRMVAYLSHAYALAGRTDDALRELATLKTRSRSVYVPAFDIAVAYVGLNKKDQTFEWLEKSYADHSLRPYLMDPTFDSIRADPRYARLLAKLRLPLATVPR